MVDLHVPETFAVILGLSSIMSMFFGSTFALADDGHWKPFEFLEIPTDSSFQFPSDSTLPTIKVQSELSEGLGWEGHHPWSVSKALHVVISVANAGQDEVIPIPGHQIRIKSHSFLPCIAEQGNGGFDDCSFVSDRSREFVTNLLGRVSFSIPLDGIDSLDHSLPPIFIQSVSMPRNEW